ncbi:MAG: polyamine aminopropyltransferase [Candidatus Nezhaarchaeales archaeon]
MIINDDRRKALFFIEQQTPNTSVIHKVKRVIHSERTKYQQLDIIETYDYGVCLILDGKVQSSLVDEWIYHEALVHPAMVTHPKPERVLIIGGGEGGVAREALKHNTVKEALMVDIDEGVINASKKYLNELHQGAFNDPRLKLFIADGREFLKTQPDSTFDVVIVDVTDPLEGGPSYLLYTKEFYGILYRKLKEDGVMVTQATSTFYSPLCSTSIYATINSIFPYSRPYQAWIASYHSTWGFTIGSKKYDPLELSEDVIEERLRERRVKGLRFYTAHLHKAIFVLPKYLIESLSKGRIIADDQPVFMPA